MDIVERLMVDAVVAIIVAYFTTRHLAGRDEARRERARQDMAARREADLAIGSVRKRLLEELGNRQLVARGRQAPRQFMTLYDFEEIIWPVLQALEDPALDRGVAERVRRRLTEILGPSRYEFLRSLAQAPSPPKTVGEMSRRLLESPALEEGLEALHNAPIDAVFQTRDPAAVADLLSKLEEVRGLFRS